jgi:hypothetical protein
VNASGFGYALAVLRDNSVVASSLLKGADALFKFWSPSLDKRMPLKPF